MKMILKTTALCLCGMTLLSATAFAKGNLPLRETFENMGFTVSWDQESQCVSIEKDGYKFCEQVGTNIHLDYDKTYISEEFAESIFSAYTKEALSSNATVVEVGENYILADSEKLGEVIFMFDENTHIHHEINRRLYTSADIKAGDSLKVYYSEAMTASLPPQTYATEIVFLNMPVEEVEVEETVSLTKSGKVTKISEDYFVIETENGSHRFNCDENTNIHHIKNKMFYTISDLSEGMEVEVSHADATTMSIPPQSYAFEVVIK